MYYKSKKSLLDKKIKLLKCFSIKCTFNNFKTINIIKKFHLKPDFHSFCEAISRVNVIYF